jgi:hypothetical protein
MLHRSTIGITLSTSIKTLLKNFVAIYYHLKKNYFYNDVFLKYKALLFIIEVLLTLPQSMCQSKL